MGCTFDRFRFIRAWVAQHGSNGRPIRRSHSPRHYRMGFHSAMLFWTGPPSERLRLILCGCRSTHFELRPIGRYSSPQHFEMATIRMPMGQHSNTLSHVQAGYIGPIRMEAHSKQWHAFSGSKSHDAFEWAPTRNVPRKTADI